MALTTYSVSPPRLYPDNEVVVCSQMADISTAGSCWAVATARGKVVRAYSVIHSAITGSDCTWSLEINDVAVAVSTVTVTSSGATAGDTDGIEISAQSTTNAVNEGDNIEFVSAGESSTTTIATFFAVIRVQ